LNFFLPFLTRKFPKASFTSSVTVTFSSIARYFR
jgi:hypothetical protein